MSHSDNVFTADTSSHSPPPPPPPTPLKSSITSHHHVIDPDILLDRLGLEELGPPLLVPHHHPSHIHTIPASDTAILAPHSLQTLSTLPERMSEESLEDSHAFTDITPNSSHVHHGSQDSMLLLEPLQEVVDEENEDGPTYKNPLMNSSMVKNHPMNDAESYMAPLHFNVLRVSMSDVRLLGSSSTSNGPLLSLSSRSSSRSRTPRDVSPSPQSVDYHHHHHPSIDPDILLDRLGLVELEPHHHPSNADPNTSSSSSLTGGGSSNPSAVVATPLPSLPERMSDETLEDCHAFTEFKLVMRPRLGSASSSQSESGTTTPTSCGNLIGLLPGSLTREGSVSGGSILGDASLLETLEEFDDEDEEEEDEADHHGEYHEEGGKPPRMKKHFGKKLNSEKNLDIIEEKDSDL